MFSNRVKIFESFDPVGLQHEYADWAHDRIGLIRARQSHVYVDGNGRRWFVLVVWYVEHDASAEGDTLE